MGRLRVAADHRHFEKDGKQYFLMADTCWSAFTNISDEEWEEYLTIRKEQGFNAVQIDILPQWDRGIAPGENMVPFLPEGKTELRLSDIPEAYFSHIEAFLKVMKEKEMTPVLVLLWANYTQGTFFDQLWGRMPLVKEDVVTYVQKAAGRFASYDPVYFVSGDTSFSDVVVDDYYVPALEALKETDPEALASLHICGNGFTSAEEIKETIPERLLYHKDLDFYVFQSGHFDGFVERCTDCARGFLTLDVKKPVFNAEPCYEGWDTMNGIHQGEALNQTTWHAIMAGADAGLTYGAQGIWQWYREGDFFAPTDVKDARLLYRCLRPFKAKDALKFEGARNRSLARYLMEKYQITNVTPDERFEAFRMLSFTRLSTANDGEILMVFAPRSQETRVNIPLGGRKVDVYSLKTLALTEVPVTEDADGFTIGYGSEPGSYLAIAYRE